jgi:hypothetical protein
MAIENLSRKPATVTALAAFRQRREDQAREPVDDRREIVVAVMDQFFHRMRVQTERRLAPRYGAIVAAMREASRKAALSGAEEPTLDEALDAAGIDYNGYPIRQGGDHDHAA